MEKQIFVVALNNRIEALRMAAGLTLLDDPVSVTICGEVGPEAEEHLEALDFADVPVARIDLNSDEGIRSLAAGIAASDAVYMV